MRLMENHWRKTVLPSRVTGEHRKSFSAGSVSFSLHHLLLARRIPEFSPNKAFDKDGSNFCSTPFKPPSPTNEHPKRFLFTFDFKWAIKFLWLPWEFVALVAASSLPFESFQLSLRSASSTSSPFAMLEKALHVISACAFRFHRSRFFFRVSPQCSFSIKININWRLVARSDRADIYLNLNSSYSRSKPELTLIGAFISSNQKPAILNRLETRNKSALWGIASTQKETFRKWSIIDNKPSYTINYRIKLKKREKRRRGEKLHCLSGGNRKIKLSKEAKQC